MADEKRKEGEAPEVVEQIATETETKTYSEEEHEAEVQAALKAQYNELNKPLSRQGAENKRLKDEIERMRGNNPTQANTRQAEGQLQILEEIVAGDSYGDNPKLKEMLRQTKDEVNKQKNVSAWQDAVSKQRDHFTQILEEAGLEEDDERLDSAWDAFRIGTYSGDFSDAERRVQRVVGKVKPEAKPKGESADLDNLTTEQEEKIARRYADKAGETKMATSASSAGGKRSFTWAEIDDMSYAEWKPLEAAIDVAKREGRIT